MNIIMLIKKHCNTDESLYNDRISLQDIPRYTSSSSIGKFVDLLENKWGDKKIKISGDDALINELLCL